MLPLIADLNQLYEEIFTTVVDGTLVVEKVEPTIKPRTAAGVGMADFLDVAYALRDYEKRNIREGAILKEQIGEKMQRFSRTLTALEGSYGVSFDWSGFDTQLELVQLMTKYYANLVGNDQKDKNRILLKYVNQVPYLSGVNLSDVTGTLDRRVNYDWVTSQKWFICDKHGEELGYDDEWMSSNCNIGIHLEHGLVSGSYATKLLGTMFNRSCSKTAEKLNGETPLMSYYAGDDNLTIFARRAAALAWIARMIANNIKAKADIFGISYESGEFLRTLFRLYKDTEYGNGHKRVIQGYSGRLNPNYTKDWNPPAKNGPSRLQRLVGIMYQLKDRGIEEESVYTAIKNEKEYWSRKNMTSEKWFDIPRSLGGTGINDRGWEGHYFQKQPGGKLAKIKFNNSYVADVLNSMPNVTLHSWQNTLSKYKVNLSERQAVQMRDVAMADTIGLNHVPKYVKDYLKRLDIPKNVVLKKVQETYDMKIDVLSELEDAVRKKGFIETPKVLEKYKFMRDDFEVLSLYKRVNKDFKLVDALSESQPDLKSDITRFEKKGMSRRDTLDLLINGSVPGVLADIHNFRAQVLGHNTAIGTLSVIETNTRIEMPKLLWTSKQLMQHLDTVLDLGYEVLI
jgi:hypothetical protein